MIYLDQLIDNYLHCLIECIYLGESLDTRHTNSNIYIMPFNPDYITNKTVIISDFNYPEDKINLLLKNNCKIISRVKYNNPNILYQPYILRPNFNIMWGGNNIEECSLFSYNKLIETGDIRFDFEKNILYFPKVNNLSLEKYIDEENNLNSLGWALQQVGINLKIDTYFKDMDIIKTLKTPIS